MIYRFTNSKGRHHYGIAVELVANGAYILGDAWEIAPASFGYISFEPNPFVIAEVKHELFPLTTPVTWRTTEIAQIVRLMTSGQFDDWWRQHRAEIVKKFSNTRYKSKRQKEATTAQLTTE